MVILFDGVERIIDVADKIEDELQGHQPLARQSGGVAQLLGKLLDLVDDTVVLRAAARRRHRRQGRFAKTRLGQVRARRIEFHIMPLRRRRPPLRAFFEQNVRPGGLAANVCLGPGVGLVGREQLGDLLLCCTALRLQQAIGDQSHDHVPLGTPPPARRGRQQEHDRRQAKGGKAKTGRIHRDLHGSKCVVEDRNSMLPSSRACCRPRRIFPGGGRGERR